MTPISKAPASRTATSQIDLRGTNLYRVAIVGAASLAGKEIAEVVRDRNFPAADIRLLDDDEDDIPGVLDAGALPGFAGGARLLLTLRAQRSSRTPPRFRPQPRPLWSRSASGR